MLMPEDIAVTREQSFEKLEQRAGEPAKNAPMREQAVEMLQNKEFQTNPDQLMELHVRERTAALRKVNDDLQREINDRKRVEKELRESEEKYSIMVENSFTGIYIDQDNKIVFANKKFADIYGYRKEELYGLQSWRLVHPEDRALTARMRRRRLKGFKASPEYEARGLTKNNETIWVKRRNTLITYKGKPAVLGNIVDVTKRKRTERKLRKVNEELKNFVHVVSHDLKSPLIAIQGFSLRLAKNYQEKLGNKGRTYLNYINSNAHRMEVFVSDLLALSKIGRVVSSYQNVSLHEIVEKIIPCLRDRLDEKGIRLLIKRNLPALYCDGNRLYQVFENLLTNAVKYIGDRENPEIEIGFKDKDEYHQFFVRDNGIGIDPKHHGSIFKNFHRLKEINDEGGSGLGLAIVDRIVTSHGGKVWVESEKGRGATFYFTLPNKYPALNRCHSTAQQQSFDVILSRHAERA